MSPAIESFSNFVDAEVVGGVDDESNLKFND